MGCPADVFGPSAQGRYRARPWQSRIWTPARRRAFRTVLACTPRWTPTSRSDWPPW